jgi:hypothetical protein
LADCQGSVTGATPAPSTRGKVASRCKKVGTEYPFFGSNRLVALFVQTESVKPGPKCGTVLEISGFCCEKANISRLVVVQIDVTNPTLLDCLVLHIHQFLDSGVCAINLPSILGLQSDASSLGVSAK